ncbi:CS1-pili formation C-terminal domain-containing protein [Burkholderia lata]|uniref:CS1-pili formation C-terminal domain-containing protein n=1 Tax=Burkholderia lata (strain ATCC 17760 / DSM 23089 / LMG 22485 / NCIMB 9086 / R18194 / 383) TaxID=482957 RepID=UPI00399C2A20
MAANFVSLSINRKRVSVGREFIVRSACRLAMAAWASGAAFAAAAQQPAPSLVMQAEQLPADFRDHFFDVPLAMRVERDGQFLGDALGLLSASGTVQLIEFTDADSSSLPADERRRWLALLEAPRALGPCERRCDGLVALHYSVENAVLSIATTLAERSFSYVRYHALPQSGSSGVIVHNNLNLSGGAYQSVAGRYSIDAIGSIGNWSLAGSFLTAQSLERHSEQLYSIPRLYLQREYEGRFVRAGLFVPDMQGGIRTPATPGGLPSTTIGVMAGSSDVLEITSAQPSLYPVYVTANRTGSVEVFRDGVLLYTQPVEPGLQRVDTRALPGGIYDVEIRLVEDGIVTSTHTELIYKPTRWRNPDQRVRYAFYVGQERTLLDRGARDDGHVAFGGVINWLAHPRLVVGATARQIGRNLALGSSIDWQIGEHANLYANAYRSSRYGVGVDVQMTMRYHKGNVAVSHNRAWQHADEVRRAAAARTQYTSVSWGHRFNGRSGMTARATYSTGVTKGSGVDLGLTHSHRLFKTDASWRASVFDRPGGGRTGDRNRGVDVTLSLALGNEGRHYSVSTGTRSAGGGRDHYATFGIRQDLANLYVRTVGASVTADRHGVGMGATALFEHRLAHGDAFAQRSSYNGGFSGGINLFNSVAFGGGAAALSGSTDMMGTDTGMIVEVESDLDDVAIQAHDSHGRSAMLKPGRNFVPVTAYRSGTLQFDFDHADEPAAVVQPVTAEYHMNRGGVGYRKVRVMKTVTVLGRVVNEQGEPLRGAHVLNHAGRAVTEADGFFSMELSERTPTVTVRRPGGGECEISLAGRAHERDADALLVGDLQCVPPQWAEQAERPEQQG